MKILEKFENINAPAEEVINEADYIALYGNAPIYSDTVDFNYTTILEWSSEDQFKIQADRVIKALVELSENQKFDKLRTEYFMKPVMPGELRLTADSIKATAEQVYFKLKRAKEQGIDIKTFNPYISTLEFKCGPGGLTNIQNLNNMLGGGNFKDDLYNAKYEYIQNLAREFLHISQKNHIYHYHAGNEVHEVNALINACKRTTASFHQEIYMPIMVQSIF